MSHHFDTPTAREDPRINVCDFYLFRGRPGFTVMAMTVNPNAGQSGPDTFREEGLYAFRFDLDGDAREEVSFKVRFGAVFHADDKDHAHAQSFEVRRASGPAGSERRGRRQSPLARRGALIEAESGVKVFRRPRSRSVRRRRGGPRRIPNRVLQGRQVSSRRVSKPAELLCRTECHRDRPRGPDGHDRTRALCTAGRRRRCTAMRRRSRSPDGDFR